MGACAWVLKAVMRDLDLDLGVSEPQKGLELGLTRWIHTQFWPGIVPSRRMSSFLPPMGSWDLHPHHPHHVTSVTVFDPHLTPAGVCQL